MNTQLTLRPMMPEEQKYSYTQSRQIMGQTGCIGHLRAWLDNDGSAFPSSWDDHSPSLKTEEFKEEFNWVVNQLRFSEEFGAVLQNRQKLKDYCYANIDGAFDLSQSKDFGFRADTKDYSYMLRLNPLKGYHNAYIYCYKKPWLDRHLTEAQRGIRFVNTHYKDIFRLDDGEKIKITEANGQSQTHTCRYIDTTHLEVDGDLFHICEFAGIMEARGCKVEPEHPLLPETCLTIMPGTDEVIQIFRGEEGYHKTLVSADSPENLRAYVDGYNRENGVTKAQESAMLAGSMFGWGTRGADPRRYDAQGKPEPTKMARRGFDR